MKPSQFAAILQNDFDDQLWDMTGLDPLDMKMLLRQKEYKAYGDMFLRDATELVLKKYLENCPSAYISTFYKFIDSHPLFYLVLALRLQLYCRRELRLFPLARNYRKYLPMLQDWANARISLKSGIDFSQSEQYLLNLGKNLKELTEDDPDLEAAARRIPFVLGARVLNRFMGPDTTDVDTAASLLVSQDTDWFTDICGDIMFLILHSGIKQAELKLKAKAKAVAKAKETDSAGGEESSDSKVENQNDPTILETTVEEQIPSSLANIPPYLRKVYRDAQRRVNSLGPSHYRLPISAEGTTIPPSDPSQPDTSISSFGSNIDTAWDSITEADPSKELSSKPKKGPKRTQPLTDRALSEIEFRRSRGSLRSPSRTRPATPTITLIKRTTKVEDAEPAPEPLNTHPMFLGLNTNLTTINKRPPRGPVEEKKEPEPDPVFGPELWKATPAAPQTTPTPEHTHQTPWPHSKAATNKETLSFRMIPQLRLPTQHTFRNGSSSYAPKGEEQVQGNVQEESKVQAQEQDKTQEADEGPAAPFQVRRTPSRLILLPSQYPPIDQTPPKKTSPKASPFSLTEIQNLDTVLRNLAEAKQTSTSNPKHSRHPPRPSLAKFVPDAGLDAKKTSLELESSASPSQPSSPIESLKSKMQGLLSSVKPRNMSISFSPFPPSPSVEEEPIREETTQTDEKNHQR
ncbi:hypothetical protein TWF481_006596 [Arthrobotrys musiformis]|uniref:Uncharacterized protein n=1 Tax=Arthrobotrys musiformis TaxID=47236 RepID=A0AAV9WAY9_9PEZI